MLGICNLANLLFFFFINCNICGKVFKNGPSKICDSVWNFLNFNWSILEYCPIWYYFLYFVVTLFAAARVVFNECFNCSCSLSKWHLLSACTVIELWHSTTDRNHLAVSKYHKIIFLDNVPSLLNFLTHFDFKSAFIIHIAG